MRMYLLGQRHIQLVQALLQQQGWKHKSFSQVKMSGVSERVRERQRRTTLSRSLGACAAQAICQIALALVLQQRQDAGLDDGVAEGVIAWQGLCCTLAHYTHHVNKWYE